jgi:hypothetical protein
MGFIFEGNNLDTAVHMLTAIVALMVFCVSLKSYLKIKREKFFYVCMAFLFFAIREILAAANIIYFANPLITAITHFIDLVIILLFFIGVIK